MLERLGIDRSQLGETHAQKRLRGYPGGRLEIRREKLDPPVGVGFPQPIRGGGDEITIAAIVAAALVGTPSGRRAAAFDGLVASALAGPSTPCLGHLLDPRRPRKSRAPTLP